jgi:hypothetical protein
MKGSSTRTIRLVLAMACFVLAAHAAAAEPETPAEQCEWNCSTACFHDWCVTAGLANAGFDHSAFRLYSEDRKGQQVADAQEIGIRDDIVHVGVAIQPSGLVWVTAMSSEDVVEDLRCLRRSDGTFDCHDAEKQKPEREPVHGRPVNPTDDSRETKHPPRRPTNDASPAIVAAAWKLCDGRRKVDSNLIESACSNVGCAVVVRGESPSEDLMDLMMARPEACVVWAPIGSKPYQPALLSGALEDWTLEGNRFCSSFNEGCDRNGACDTFSRCELFGHPDQIALDLSAGVIRVSEAKVSLARRKELPAFTSGQSVYLDGPTMRCDTPVHLSHNSGWAGPDDLSMNWQFAYSMDELLIQATVRDNEVVPMGHGPDVASDHLELAIGKRRIALLLAPPAGGALPVQIREWQDAEGHEVDTPFRGSGAWTQRSGGYLVQARVPLKALGIGSLPVTLKLELEASDSDRGVPQKALIGSTVEVVLWKDFPPTVEDFRRVEPRK